MFATEKNGFLHVCVDYRELTVFGKWEVYATTRLGDNIDFLGKAEVLSALDAEIEYWQGEIKTIIETKRPLPHSTKFMAFTDVIWITKCSDSVPTSFDCFALRR